MRNAGYTRHGFRSTAVLAPRRVWRATGVRACSYSRVSTPRPESASRASWGRVSCFMPSNASRAHGRRPLSSTGTRTLFAAENGARHIAGTQREPVQSIYFMNSGQEETGA